MKGRVWRCRDHSLELGLRTLVMGIVNVTPDSFSDGGLFARALDAVAHGAGLVVEGAYILDVGGVSTRPGSDEVPADEELARILPVIEGLRSARPDVPISADTRKPEVAAKALAAGASIVNDVTAATIDRTMFAVAGDAGAGMVLMHMLGEPRTMQDDPRYDDVVAEVHEFLRERVEAALFAGITAEHLAIDPGIGFGKTVEHNLELLRNLHSFRDLGAAVMVGASRKRFIGTLTGVEDAAGRVEGSIAAAVWSAAQGVDVLRVHDVGQTVCALKVADAIVRGAP
jgi:dihydropteroate synthase